MTSPRILVVDDNPTNLLLISEVLQMEGYDVLCASNAEIAQHLVEKSRPQLILMDIGLPGMDGLALTRALKADPATRPIVIAAVTAAAMKSDEEKALAAGCDGYIAKPIDTRALPAQVARLLGRNGSPAPTAPPIPNGTVAEAPPARVSPRHSLAGATAAPESILIVDDHATNRLLLREVLESSGFNVYECADGLEALATLENVAVEAIVSDVLMPNMDGITLCMEVRRHSRLRPIPFVIYTSTYNSGSDRELALSAGADAYLVKPAAAPEILRVLAEARERKRRPLPSPAPADDEVVVIKQYNAALIAKLEERNADLSRMVEELKSSEASFHAVQERARLGSWEIDVSTRAVRWSREMFKLFNHPSETAPDFGTFFTLIHGSDRARVRDFYEKLLRSPAVPGQDVDFRTNPQHGPIRHLSSMIETVRDSGGATVKILGTTLDVTERKQAEESLREREAYFRLLIENASDIITVLGPDGAIQYQSPSTARILGHNLAETQGRNLADLIHPEDVPRVQRALRDAITSPGMPMTLEFRIRDRDTAWRILESVGQCIIDDHNRHLIVINSRDVTASRSLEDQFRQAQKMEAIGTLAGGIAHDFNNILAAIGGYTELARMTLPDDPSVQSHLTAVLKATARATDLVRQILAFSRQQEHERRPLALWRVVEEALSLLRATIPAMIEFDTDIAHEARAVLGDPTQIHQVMMNLCTNAWHAMHGRAGQLTIKLENVDVDAPLAARVQGLKPGPHVRLSIGDTGTGMDEPTLARIFEPFFTTKAPGEGTGLGLSVVHGIMHSHDGAIAVTSEPGVGTTFALYFPALDQQPLDAAGSPTQVPRGAGERIFYIDDEEMLTLLAQQMLEGLGYRVRAETDPARALELLRSDPHAFDLVITDLAMPGLSGTELARKVSALRPDLPIILTSGYAASLTNENVRELGIRELLPKPPTLEEFAGAVQRVLATRPAPPASRHVLLIEDEAAFRDVLRQMLEAKGFRVTEARHGREGVALYQREPADLVITDLVMPDQEGIETIQALRRANRSVKIIAMSGGGRNSAHSYLELAKRMGALETLAKPFSREELFLALERVLA